MSYTPTIWATGDTLTASAMNKIENGIANAGGGYDLVIKTSEHTVPNITTESLTLIKGSWTDCAQKIKAGLPITVFVYGVEQYEDEFYCYSMNVVSVYADLGYHNAVEIQLSEEGTTVRNAGNTGSVIIYGAGTTLKTISFTESGLSV